MRNRADKIIVKTIFLIPFHDNDIMQLYDTIDSIKHYVKDSYSIICINDCKDRQNIELFEKRMLSNDSVINFVPSYDASWPQNTYGSLFCKKYQGIDYVLKHFSFDFLVFMDTDALITGFSLIECVNRYFEGGDSEFGMIGSYKIRVDGKRRTRWQWALYILYLVYFRKSISRKSLIWKIWISEASKNGYKLGEHMLGGAFIASNKCIKKMIELYPYDLILKDKIYLISIGDDVIFSLLTFASKYKIGDFGRPDDPMAVALNYLPISKEEIVKQKKQIIHSVRKGFNGENEKELRTYFKSLRK